MASILTNTNSQVALQTLRGINRNISDITSEISTGKKVASAADNAAIWAVSTVIESDVKGFEKISESLNLGKSTVAVARSAAEQVTGLLQEIKGLVVAAQEDNVDRTKIQTDIGELRNQINSIVDAAQFNGLNLVKGTESVEVLASLDRSNDGTVSASNITINRQNLETTQAGADTTTSANAADSVAAADIDGASGTGTLDFSSLSADDFQAGDTIVVSIADSGGTQADAGTTITYTVTAADIAAEDGAAGFGTAIATGIAGTTPSATLTETSIADNGDGTLTVTNSNGTSANEIDVSVDATGQDLSAQEAGGLAELASLDVSTAENAETALTNIETLIQSGIDAAAAFGSAEKRIEIQNEFVTNLRDSLNAGIGALRDSDLEAASARLQSLQVQQQLGIQALGIANAQPQNILSLFR